MTNEEFSTWSRNLFIAFPSLWEWLQSSSPAPLETQAIWRKCLQPFSAEECGSVIDRWANGALEPFAAYERDKVHLIVRSICAADRDRERKKLERVTMATPYRDKRGFNGDQIGVGTLMDGSMKAAVVEGAIEHKRLLDGEIDRFEYEQLREAILVKHGIVEGRKVGIV